MAFAAAHVVGDPLGANAPGAPAAVDWEHTLGFRRYLWSLGLSVAEAMDTAQRGMGLDWAATQELIRRSAAEASAAGGGIAVGAGTDQLAPGNHPLDAVTDAYLEQLALAEEVGAQPILMASRALCAAAIIAGRLPQGVRRAAGAVRRAGDPALARRHVRPGAGRLLGFSGSLGAAADTVLELIETHAAKVDGIKVSLLDAAREVALRNRLPEGVRLYTGDDFNYPDADQGLRYSDALLGHLRGDRAGRRGRFARARRRRPGDVRPGLAPTVPLSRQIFETPTYYYKTGIAFLAWLNGHQPGFSMVGGLQSGRSLPQLAQTFRLADAAGMLADPDLAVRRLRGLLAVHGVDA